MQVSPFELILRKEKWLVMLIYRSSLDSLSQFLESLTDIIDFSASSYDNFIIMGDFNAQDFINVNGLINLIELNTCFKRQGSCIDLILTNRRFSFKQSISDEAGVSHHHHLIYSLL